MRIVQKVWFKAPTVSSWSWLLEKGCKRGRGRWFYVNCAYLVFLVIGVVFHGGQKRGKLQPASTPSAEFAADIPIGNRRYPYLGYFDDQTVLFSFSLGEIDFGNGQGVESTDDTYISQAYKMARSTHKS
jgi:hypothetical protein